MAWETWPKGVGAAGSVSWAVGVIVALVVAGCSAGDTETEAVADPSALSSAEPAGPPPEVLGGLNQPWTGDLDGMVQRRLVRALVSYNRTSFFLDGGRQRGTAADAMELLEKQLNEGRGRGALEVDVIAVPVARDRLIPALEEGLGDLAMSNLTITPDRLQRVDASEPIWPGVREVVVTGPGVEAPATVEDLAGREVWVRRSSSYYESLTALDERFRSEGGAPISIMPVDERLETEDVLEMVAAGIFPMTVADDYLALFWADVLEGLTVHEEVAVRSAGDIAWMFRKDSPQLAAAVNRFVRDNRKGTLIGNLLAKRYLRTNEWVRNSLVQEDVDALRQLADVFQQWAEEYDFDWLMVAAQAYQESGLDNGRVSRAGAVGIMQMLRSTAADPNVGIRDIDVLERNIEAGCKYMRFILDRYLADAELDELNQHLFAFASYNAGPSRIARLREQAAREGFDPTQWFDNVEIVVAREVGREPVQYVSNILKYYVAYSLVRDRIAGK